MIALGSVVILILGGTFYWVAHTQETYILQQVHAQAKALYDNIALTRAWMASNGGVYLESDRSEANPYLIAILGEENVLYDGVDGQTFILHNPELVTRQLADLANERGEDFIFRITSLKLLNPHNAPTDWETSALQAFENGQHVATTTEYEDTVEMYRYMVPLVTNETCLQCHAQQGYQVGDIRGGISVSIPMTEARAAIIDTRWRLFFIGLAVTGGVFLLLFVLIDRLVLHPLQELHETARHISLGQRDKRVSIRSNDELGSLAQSFNEMTNQLQQALTSSEQMVVERTKRLKTVATLSERLNAILDIDQLLIELVTQVKDRFNYYHVQLYMIDEAHQNLMMRASVGKLGITVKPQGHAISLNSPTSRMARAARTQETVIIDNIRELDSWTLNPLLPDTFSEMAVPIIWKGEVMGVLDVQEDRVAALDEGDASLLQSLANHVAVALNNANLFQQTQFALADMEKLYRISQWVMMSRNLSELVSAVVEGIAIPAIHRALLLVCDYNEEGKVESLTLRASWYSGRGMPPKPHGTRYSWTMSTVVTMSLTPEPLLFDDIQHDNRVDADTLAGAKQRNVRAMAVLPLLSQGKQMGVLLLLGEESYHFKSEEIRPYFSLLAQLAVAVENQHLLEQTQQRATELEEAHNYLNSIVENIPSMLFVKDAQALRFVQWNRAAERLTGVDEADVIGRRGYSFLRNKDADQWLAQDQQVLTDGKLLDMAEETIHTGHRGERIFHTRRVPIWGANGKAKYILGISEDITDSKRAEMALQEANQQLTKLNADKDKFLSIMAHDLRSPFSPLLGMSELLVDISKTGTPEEISDLSNGIHRSAKNVFGLLENLLEWSRIQRGHMSHEPTSFDLYYIIDQNVQLLSVNATHKGITLAGESPKGLYIYADEQMIDTVIRNLISNALKFTPNNGKVTVCATSPVNQDSAELCAEIAVIDTGVGISEKVVNKLFKIEENVTTSGTNQEKGSGLGLIICQEMVYLNGGKIWVESELGKGTTVKFTVPMTSTDAVEPNESLPIESDKLPQITPTIIKQPLIPPSFDILNRLRDLAIVGDMVGIEAEAIQLETLDTKYRPFANKLRQFARTFDEMELLDFIEQFAERSPA